MKSRIYWGLAILIILLVGVSVVLLTRTTDTKPEFVYNPLTSEEEEQVQNVIEKSKSTTARPGYKIVPHGDHYHEVPISENVPENPTFSTVPEKVIYPHQKLLDTHPVAALLAQAKDRGHWSAKYIPPFPADDAEANELARALYIHIDHFKIKGFTDDDPETKMPAIREASKVIYEDYFAARTEAAGKAAETGRLREARWYDLWKLNWANRDSLPISTNRLHIIPSSFNNQGGSQ